MNTIARREHVFKTYLEVRNDRCPSSEHGQVGEALKRLLEGHAKNKFLDDSYRESFCAGFVELGQQTAHFNENSGHYGWQWDAERRQAFEDFFQRKFADSIAFHHEEWVERPLRYLDESDTDEEPIAEEHTNAVKVRSCFVLNPAYIYLGRLQWVSGI